MQKEKKARITNFLLNIVVFIIGQYLKEFFIAIHTIISKISSEKFAFLMIVIIAIIISFWKNKKEK